MLLRRHVPRRRRHPTLADADADADASLLNPRARLAGVRVRDAPMDRDAPETTCWCEPRRFSDAVRGDVREAERGCFFGGFARPEPRGEDAPATNPFAAPPGDDGKSSRAAEDDDARSPPSARPLACQTIHWRGRARRGVRRREAADGPPLERAPASRPR